MKIVNIDFSDYDDEVPHSLRKLADQLEQALSTSGFLSVTNIGISESLRDRVFQYGSDFFSQSVSEKMRCGYRSAHENFGYQRIGEEHLDPGTPSDLKETFTMRDVRRKVIDEDRWPSQDFRDLMVEFYSQCISCAKKIQRVFAIALDKPLDFFVESHSGQNISLRLLHYPGITNTTPEKGQLGAGAHTDYGMITLLFQDGIGGLELADTEGRWHSAPSSSNRILINTGDLMERWTNGRYRSTPHRVQPILNSEDRYSIAVFFDPDDETLIETLSSCISNKRPNRFDPITAGDYILKKITATHHS